MNSTIYTNDALVIFDDVFIPKERVFMDGEREFSGDMWPMPLATLIDFLLTLISISILRC